MRVRNLTSLLLIVGIAVAAASWFKFADQSTPAKQAIKVGDGFWPGTYWITIADRKGWFREAGLAVELVDIAPDYYGSLTDTVEGRLDVNNFSLFDLVAFRLKGADLVGVLYSDASEGMDAVVARDGIDSLSGLIGKRVGIALGGYLEYIMDEALRRDGIDPAEIAKVQIAGEKAAEALAAGQVDAVITWEPAVGEAMKVAGARKIFDTSQLPNLSPSVLAFSRRFIERRSDDVQAFLGVWRRTSGYIETSPDEAFAIIAEARETTVEKVRALSRLDVIRNLRDNLTAFSEAAGYVSLHGRTRGINDFLIRKGQTERRLDPLDILDGRFVKALLHSRVVKAPQ